MRAANILKFQFPKEGYGPSIAATEFGERIYDINKENVEHFGRVEKFVTDWFAASDVKHLEKVSTAYYVTKKILAFLWMNGRRNLLC